MVSLKIIRGTEGREVLCESGVTLSDVLTRHGYYLPHPCGGKGTCGKCTVSVNGEATLSCRFTVNGDTTVTLPPEETLHDDSPEENADLIGEACLCLDLGSTTLALALIDTSNGRVIGRLSRMNPQRAFGADVISRIEHCMRGGTDELPRPLMDTLIEMTENLLDSRKISSVGKMYVAGNTTMLHILAGVDPSPMGKAPYTPEFLGEVVIDHPEALPQVDKMVLLPGVSAFVGADITAGISHIGISKGYRLLIDLGTNAEIALFSEGGILCTAAAAGPCFEGANISCGMSATAGAVYSCDEEGRCQVIGGGSAVGICGTGLIDAVAYGVRSDLVDEDGYLEDETLPLCDGVSLTQKDVRELQLAKSAIRAATECLIKRAGISYTDIESLYVSGGFSAALDPKNAAFIGLIPEELAAKLCGIDNSSLLGTIKYAVSGGSLGFDVTAAKYVDLSADASFSALFMDYMSFGEDE